MEGLLELGNRALDVSEMGEEDLVVLPETTDGVRNVRTHGGEVPLAEGDATVVARDQIQHALEVLDRGHDPCNPPDRRQGWIARVHGLLDTGLLGDGNNALEEILEGFPQQFLGDFPILGERRVFHQVVIVAGGQGAASGSGAD